MVCPVLLLLSSQEKDFSQKWFQDVSRKFCRKQWKLGRLLHINLLYINLWNYRFTLIYCTHWSSSLAHLRWSMTSSRPESYHKKFLPLWSFLGQVFWHPAIQVHSIIHIYIYACVYMWDQILLSITRKDWERSLLIILQKKEHGMWDVLVYLVVRRGFSMMQ